MTPPTKFYRATQVVDVIMSLKFGISTISKREVIILEPPFFQRFHQKSHPFSGVVLGQVQ